jgi:hypothetical protein
MDQQRLATVSRYLHRLPSRRDILGGLTGIGFALGTLRPEAGAKRNHQKKHKKRSKQKPPAPPPPFNDFGCLDVGQPCQGDSTLCCSGVCDPGTSTCAAHNAGTCAAETGGCTAGVPVPCHPTNPQCGCHRTTGNAGFCGDFTGVDTPDQLCRFCQKDTDCQAEFGPGAACIVLDRVCTLTCAATATTACVRPCA